MPTEAEIHACAESLDGWAYTDSLVKFDLDALSECVRKDAAACGYVMTEEQCEVFICGGPDDGEPPAHLVRDFPLTDAFVNEHW